MSMAADDRWSMRPGPETGLPCWPTSQVAAKGSASIKVATDGKNPAPIPLEESAQCKTSSSSNEGCI